MMDNAYTESLNGRPRIACLNERWLLPLADAKDKLTAWRQDYNDRDLIARWAIWPPASTLFFARRPGSHEPEDYPYDWHGNGERVDSGGRVTVSRSQKEFLSWGMMAHRFDEY